MEKSHILTLLSKCLENRLNAAEERQLSELLASSQHKEEVLSVLSEMIAGTDADPAIVPEEWKNMHRLIVSIDKPAAGEVPVRRIRSTATWWLAAASVLILISIGAWLLTASKNEKPIVQQSQPAPVEKDIAPGHEGAILTLADGTKMVLDSMGNGIISQQNGAQVELQNGQLAYHSTGGATGRIAYNTVATPRGRQFHVQLPDGSHVWLNAASSLTYPTVFSGGTREVTITGEAYFEIAKNKSLPFIVKVNDRMRVDVLGTHFNIRAYGDEETIMTTLLEGSIKVGSKILKPEEQAVFTNQSSLTIHHVDVNAVIAWKNGLFNFEDAGLEEVLRQLKRWYDIEVVYEGKIKDIRFFGEMNRNVPLSVVLKALQSAGAKFRIEGDKKLIVIP